MKREWKATKDIPLLLGMLLIFSGSIGVINGVKTTQNNDHKMQITLPSPNGPAPLFRFRSIDELWNYISKLVISESIEATARVLEQVPFDEKFALTKRILAEQKGWLRRNDKLEFLYAILLQHRDDQEKQKQLLNLLHDNQYLLKGKPLLYVAASPLYAQAIGFILNWQKSQMEKKVKSPAIRFMEQHALDTAISDGNLEALKRMVQNGIKIDKPIANDLLWEVIATKSDPEFIRFLKTLGADLDYSQDGKRTVLHFAIEQENPELVKKLLEEGADPNKMLDITVGPPLQQLWAQIKKNNELKKDNAQNININLILREFGAQG